MTYLIGIDGGGTKTTAILATKQGEVLAESKTSSTNPNLIDNEELEKRITHLLNEFRNHDRKVFSKVSSVFAGVSGAGNSDAKNNFATILRKKLPRTKNISVEADTINALYSGTYGKPGIIQIAGTGATTYGINDEGDSWRVDGWGYLLGDEGSGYYIGAEGVKSVLKSADGRGPATNLSEKIKHYFNCKNEFDLVRKIYRAEYPKNQISSIAVLVFDSYRENDEVAINIMEGAAQKLCKSIQTVNAKVFQGYEDVPVILCGGLFEKSNSLSDLLKKHLAKNNILKPSIPTFSPVKGSIIGAKLNISRNIDDEFIEALRAK
ncbi:N-acetylglucosamine kinase [Halalkalibacillus sediminis]|uniref:N-acetylglucosamine kinase n=1 Tax=Halalkalibacillus sediminis TaxID=2018042 RepID=UPI00138FCFF6|nr:BadF/BadG/BcrA/BcrD ATPase family protein [Halalkalibacillus sediminis]